MKILARLTLAAALVSLVSAMSFTLTAADDPMPDPAKKDADNPAAKKDGDAPKAKDPGKEGDGDFQIGPNYTPAPELTVKAGVPRGTVKRFSMRSEDSKLYPGIARAGGARGGSANVATMPQRYDRQVAVYIPAQYKVGTAEQPAKPAPFIIVQDGIGYVQVMQSALDTLISEKRVPVMIAIMINSGGGDAQGSERGLEYDTVSGKYAEFIETEVLPKIEKDFSVAFTKDPNGRATMGGSSGGAAAFTMAWFHPEWYHLVLTYSGTYVNQQSPVNPDSPHGAWEYHENLLPKSEAKPLRVWLEVSQNDNRSNDAESTLHNWVLANQHMRDILKAKGYHYHYVYALNAGHTDRKVRDETLPSALEWLWKGYPIE